MTGTPLLPAIWDQSQSPLEGVLDTPVLDGRVHTSELDEPALVALAGPGRDGAAFAELVRRHQGRVRGLLLRLTGSRSLADDLGQDVFLRAYRGLESFEGRAQLSTWLYRIAYNVFRNHTARVRQLVHLPAGFESSTPAPESSTSACRSDLRRDLSVAIEGLPEKYRAVVVLYYLEELSYPEIATILTCPLGTVKTHLHRAKRLLREQMPGWRRSHDGG